MQAMHTFLSRRRALQWLIGVPVARAAVAAPLPPGWTRLADLPVGQAKFGLAALGGRLCVMGGYDTRRTCWLYDLAADRWAAGPPLARGSDNLAGAAAAGRFWALGGEAGTAVQALAEEGGAWSLAAPAPAPRFAAACGVLDGRLHLAGGWNADNRASASLTRHDVFDPATGSWATAAPLRTARNAAAGAVADGRWLVLGGRAPGIRRDDQRPLDAVEQYDPAADRWSDGPPLPEPRASLAACTLGRSVFAFGGEGPAGVAGTVWRLDPGAGRWQVLAPMPAPLHGLGAVAAQGAVYVLGGFGGASDAVGTESAALYRFQPPG